MPVIKGLYIESLLRASDCSTLVSVLRLCALSGWPGLLAQVISLLIMSIGMLA